MEKYDVGPLFTLSDAAALLSGMTRRNVTVRQLRYLRLPATWRAPGQNGSRLYSTANVALFEVWRRLHDEYARQGLPLWTARAALQYCEAGILTAFEGGRRSVMVLDFLRGTARLQKPGEPVAAHEGAIDLRALRAQVLAACEAYRAESPWVYSGAAYLDPVELQEELTA